MKKAFILVVSIILLFTGFSKAQNSSDQPVVPGEWIKSWLMIGPFPLQESKDPLKIGEHLPGFDTDFLKSKGGESNLKIKEGNVVRYKGGSAKCFVYTSPDSVINLDAAISRNAPVAGYAYKEVDLTDPKMMFVSFGSREGGSLWVNGAKVWDYQPQRNLLPDNDMIPVSLKAGKNTLLFKIERRRTNWLFMARLLPFSAESLVRGGEIFKMTTDDNGDALLASRFMAPVLQQLIKNIDLEVINDQDKVVLKEQNKEDYLGKLNIETAAFQPYKAKFIVRLTNGETLRQDLPFSAGTRSEYTLFSNGKTRYRIALDANASESEKWAANELQHWLSEISGAYFPIQTMGQQRFRGSADHHWIQ